MSKTKKKKRLPKQRDPYAEMLSHRSGNFRGPHKDKRKGNRKQLEESEIQQQFEEWGLL